jgi:hypothetical protein
MNDSFSELGLGEDADERAVKRAYAAKLKRIDTEREPEAFQALRAAYENALWYARHVQRDTTATPEVMPLPSDLFGDTRRRISIATRRYGHA